MTATVVSAGLLSPEYAIGELGPSASAPYTLSVEALEPTTLVIEALTGTEASLAGFASLDGDELDWEKADTHRPDVYTASTAISTGSHSVVFADIPSQGLTFGRSTQGIASTTVPFEQGVHAGRRLLLAKPSDSPGAVYISPGEGLTVTFEETPAYAVLDLGRVVHGRLNTEISGPSGTVVDIGWDERLLTGTLRPLPYPGSLHPQWNQTDSWVLDGTSRPISTIDARAGRYVLIAVWNGSPVELQDIQIHEERYPVVQRGDFHSVSALLDDIWQVGVDTLYPNMTDAYTDTPWRERGQWWGDAYVEQHINQVAFGDTALLRRGLLLMAEEFSEGQPPARAPHGGREILLDYGMLWVQSLYDHYQMTEDDQLPEAVYPVLCEFMTYLETYEHAGTELLDLPRGHWWETALVDWRGPDSRYGQSAAINALYYGTLMDASRLAETIGSSNDARIWREKAQEVKDQVNACLYRPAQQRYATTIFQGEAVTPSIHAQAWPLAYGLVPEETVGDVASSLLELLPDTLDSDAPEIGIYGMFWVLEALGRADRVPEALDLVEAYYGRLLTLGAKTWWEDFDARSRYTASLSHGWGGAPTWFLTTHVLGARRRGTSSWIVQPAGESLQHATGTLPLQDDQLMVHWEHLSHAERSLEIVAPTNTAGEIIISGVDGMTALTLDGRTVWQRGAPWMEGVAQMEDGIHIPVQSAGTHSLHIHGGSRVLLP
jgi:alpha-L-rhamnosidase